MGVDVVGHESRWLVLYSGGGWSWGWWAIFGTVGLWGHWLVLIRVALIAFIVFVHLDVEGTGDVCTCCIGG